MNFSEMFELDALSGPGGYLQTGHLSYALPSDAYLEAPMAAEPPPVAYGPEFLHPVDIEAMIDAEERRWRASELRKKQRRERRAAAKRAAEEGATDAPPTAADAAPDVASGEEQATRSQAPTPGPKVGRSVSAEASSTAAAASGSSARVQRSKSAAAGAMKDALADIEMEREPVTPAKPARSLLGEELAPRLPITVFLPDRTPLRFRVHDRAPVEDVIHETLVQAKLAAADGQVAKDLTYPARCYELCFHDSDGLPDEDLPALERSRKIIAFAGRGTSEYCLVLEQAAVDQLQPAAEAPGQAPTLPRDPSAPLKFSIRVPASLFVLAPAARPAAEQASSDRDSHGRRRSTRSKREDLRELTVSLPGTGEARELLDWVASKHRLLVHREPLELLLCEADRERLGASSRAVPLSTPLRQLARQEVGQLTVRKKFFHDSPVRQSRNGAEGGAATAASSGLGFGGAPQSGGAATAGAAAAGGGAAAGTAGARSGRTGPLGRDDGAIAGQHTILTASRLQEWRVIKINKFGRRQERIMGLDLNRITNRKLPDKMRRWSGANVVTAERFVTDIRKVMVPSGQGSAERRQFVIVFREGDDDVTVPYEALSESDREQILSKLRYILALNNDENRLVRTGSRKSA